MFCDILNALKPLKSLSNEFFVVVNFEKMSNKFEKSLQYLQFEWLSGPLGSPDGFSGTGFWTSCYFGKDEFLNQRYFKHFSIFV